MPRQTPNHTNHLLGFRVVTLQVHRRLGRGYLRRAQQFCMDAGLTYTRKKQVEALDVWRLKFSWDQLNVGIY